MSYIIDFSRVSRNDIALVGGKCAFLGDMIQHLTGLGIKVPPGFAITTNAYKQFLHDNQLDKKIQDALVKINIEDFDCLKKSSADIRNAILAADMPQTIIDDISKHYQTLAQNGKCNVAARSSATAEDLPEASFAGQQETLLNISNFANLLDSIKIVYASLFSERAISYRVHHHIPHEQVAISVGVQRMIRSDIGASGVTFTLDTESGFDKVVMINGVNGLGEAIVQGKVNPDEFYVHKPTLNLGFQSIISRKLGNKSAKMIYADNLKNGKPELVATSALEQQTFCITDEDVLTLAKEAVLIENFYQMPMDIEWAKDGIDNQIYTVQARPETIKSCSNKSVLEQYSLLEKSKVITVGRSVGQRIGQGTAKVITSHHDKHLIQKGDVLVTDCTDPDWEPIMKLASGIITNRGGRTCHAAIIARELGIPAVVGCQNATDVIKTNDQVTLSCAEGEKGFVYEGILKFDISKLEISEMPPLPVKMYMNIGNPDQAFAAQFIPNEGVGLARIEFVISNMIGIHPNAILQYPNLPDDLKLEIQHRTAGYSSPIEFYIEKLSEGISIICAAFYPKPVIVRFSDFKSNEYYNLIGGSLYEKHEPNPMLGYRGAYRYITEPFSKCFDMECEAVKRARNQKGLTNLHVMVPFVRTYKEAEAIANKLIACDLKRGDKGLEHYMMCEIPSNVILAEKFLTFFDGYSIGSNDLTQLTLGVDRDSELVADIFDERDDAVKSMLHSVIANCHAVNKYIGICGQGPSDHTDFAEWLLKEGITSMSLNPDTIVKTWLALAGSSQLTPPLLQVS